MADARSPMTDAAGPASSACSTRLPTSLLTTRGPWSSASAARIRRPATNSWRCSITTGRGGAGRRRGGGGRPVAGIRRAAAAGARFGPYRVVGEIGRGGMGVVFEAERDDGTFAKRVALKVATFAAWSPEFLHRFRDERQILARLEHPHIARLLDGGTSDDGVPYFAMEFVEGVPITAYAAARRQSVTERLRLFLQVCEAVEYAHQNLVIHRDLKPGNILVAGDSVRLLDFGISKLMEGRDAAATATGLLPFTPAYCSPEQLRGEPVTTRTDVYALGLVLFEILTGARAQPVDTTSPVALEHTIVETPVPAPSVTLQAAGDAAGARRAARRSRHHRPDRDGEGTGPALSLRRRTGRRRPPPPRRQAAGRQASQHLVPSVALRPPPLATADRGHAAARGHGCRNRFHAGAGGAGRAALPGGAPHRQRAARRRARRDPRPPGVDRRAGSGREHGRRVPRGPDPRIGRRSRAAGRGRPRVHQGWRAGVLAVAAEPRTPRRRTPLPDAGARGARTAPGRAARRSAGRPGGGRARGGVGRLLSRDRPERGWAEGLRGGRPRRGDRGRQTRRRSGAAGTTAARLRQHGRHLRGEPDGDGARRPLPGRGRAARGQPAR